MIAQANKAMTSIRSRLVFIIIIVTTITLFLAASMFTYMQMREYKLALAENLSALGAKTSRQPCCLMILTTRVQHCPNWKRTTG